MKTFYTKPVATSYDLHPEAPILAGSGQPHVTFTLDDAQGTVNEYTMFSNKFRPNHSAPWSEDF